MNIPYIIRHYGGTILLYAVGLVLIYLLNADVTIQSFSEHIVSSASVVNYQIDARTQVYYLSLLLWMVAAVVLFFVCLGLERWLLHEDRAVLNTSSYFALTMLGLMVFTAQDRLPYVLYGVPIFHGLILIHSALHYKRSPVDFKGGEYYGWLLAITLSLVFVVVQYCLPWYGIDSHYADLMVFAGIAVLIHLLMALINPRQYKKTFQAIVYIVLPFMLLPLLIIGTEEAVMIQQVRNLVLISSTQLYMVGVFVLDIWLVVRFLRVRLAHRIPSSLNLIQWQYFPWLIASVITFIWYEPVATVGLDMFEPANPGLMIQQFFDFRSLPYLQNFNAHGLSDALWGFLYTALNGFVDHTWTHYDFLQRVIELVVGYLFLVFVTKNPYFALAAVVTLPFVDALFPAFFTVILIALVLLWQTIQKQKLYWYLILFVYLVSLFFWRIDIGVGTIMSAAISAGLWRFCHSHLRIQWSALVTGLAITIGLVGGILGLGFFITQTNPLDWVTQLLHILKSNQAFGYAFIRNGIDVQFYWGYGVVPLALLMLTAYLCYVIRWQKQSKQFFDLALIFLSVFTLINFSRGLVRHNLSESVSYYILPFGVLIIGLFILRFVKVKIPSIAVLLCVFAMASIAYFLSYTQVPFLPLSPTMTVNVVDKLHNSFLKRIAASTPEPIIERSLIPPTIQDSSFAELVSFIDANLTADQTFFDFSNSPMLYYYAHKRLPQYANHFILMHDQYLQHRLVEQLKEYDIPIVVFSYAQPYVLDDLQFNWRLYAVAEHIYQYYQPYRIMNGREVWIRNDWQPLQEPVHDSTSELVLSSEEFAEEVLLIQTVEKAVVYPVMQYPLAVADQETCYVHITGTSQQNGVMRLYYQVDGTPFTDQAMVDFSVLTGWNDLYMKLPERDEAWTLTGLQLEIFPESQFTVDTFELAYGLEPTVSQSVVGQTVNLGYIPYLWGELGDLDYASMYTLRTKAQFEASLGTLTAGTKLHLPFDPLTEAEKSNGNYIIIDALTASADLPANLTVQFGQAESVEGSIEFTTLADGQSHRYAVRVSADYDWYADDNTWIDLSINQGLVTVQSLEIIQAELI